MNLKRSFWVGAFASLLLMTFFLLFKQSSKPALSSKPKLLSIAMVWNRALELEPCGCSFSPAGGVKREQNLLKAWAQQIPKESFLYFTAGTTFIPMGLKFNPDEMNSYRQDAGKLVQAMNIAGTTALVPEPDDLLIGMQSIEKLKSESKFPWVSASLYQDSHPIFTPYLELSQFNPPVVFTGLSTHSGNYGMTEESVQVLKPEVALARVLRSLPKREQFLIVAGNFDSKQKKELLEKFPEISLFMGGPDAATTRIPQDQLAEKTLAISSLGQGRELVRLDILLAAGGTHYQNDEFSERLVKFYNVSKEKLGKTPTALPFQFVSQRLDSTYDKAPRSVNTLSRK